MPNHRRARATRRSRSPSGLSPAANPPALSLLLPRRNHRGVTGHRSSIIMFKQAKKVAKKGAAKLAKAASKATVKIASKGGAAGKAAVSKKTLQRVYYFGPGKTEGRADMKDLLGGKGANL